MSTDTRGGKGKHTPVRGWILQDDWLGIAYFNPEIEAGNESIDDPRHDSVVARFDGDFNDEEAQANAEFVFRACNSHEELLSALKGMLEWARRVKGTNPGPEILNAINAVDKAEGNQE